MVGVLREGLISSNQKNHANYVLLTLDRDTPDWGRFRVFEMLKSTTDDIPDDLLQWLPNANIRTGEPTKVEDPLIARDAWINSLWVGHDYKLRGLLTSNYLKYDLYHQRLSANERALLGLRERDFFFGLINKISYRFDFGHLWLEPRWKSEYRRQSRDLTSADERTELAEIGGFVLGFPLLSHTTLLSGLEMTFLNDMERDSNDFNGLVWALQLSNISDYLGYKVTTHAGMKIDRRQPRGEDAVIINQIFISIYAGLQ